VSKKSSQQKCFFALLAFALQNGQNLGLNYLSPCFARTGRPFWQNFLCPATALTTIVLTVFARSCSADTLGKTRAFSYKHTQLKFCKFSNPENGSALLNTFEKSFTCEKF